MSNSYCSGNTITCSSVEECSENDDFTLWVQSWAPGGTCIKLAESMTYHGASGALILLDEAGYTASQDMAVSAIRKYESVGFKITGPGKNGFSPLQNSFARGCNTIPGLCENYLHSYCSGLTREDISEEPQLLEWCGCYAPPFDISGVPNVAAPCDVLCDSIGTIRLPFERPIKSNNRTLETLDFASCQETVCIISGVTINAANTSLTTVNFNQLCSSCDKADSNVSDVTCKCIIEGDAFGKLVDPPSFNQVCGKDSICIQEINGERKVVPCKSEGGGHPVKHIKTTIPVWFWWVLGIFVISCIVIVLSLSYGRRKKVAVREVTFS